MVGLGYLVLVVLGFGAATGLFLVGAVLAGIGAILFVVVFICYCVWDWFSS